MITKIILGTAQFGLDYGVNNKKGRILKKEVFEILNYAWKNKVRILDTALTYGESEKIIGKFIKKKRVPFKIISKLPKANSKTAGGFFSESLARLGQDKIYGYLVHNFKSFLKNNLIWDTLEKLKAKGRIKKIGFSLYYPQELKYLLKHNFNFDIVQFPYNIFDQRFAPHLSLLKKRNIEIHVRSVFLQGLMFKKPGGLSPQFKEIRPKLEFLNKVAQDLNISMAALCLNFVVLNKNVDKIIIGVNNLDNLKENIKALKYRNRVKKIYNNLLSLKDSDEKIILPLNWN